MDIRQHFKDNKQLYTGLAIGVGVAGFTCLIMRSCHADAQGVLDGPTKVTVQPLSFFSKQTNTITTTVNRGGGGSPSYIVECLSTGEAFLSQRQAAIAKGISESILSGHLNGKFEDADGLLFRRIGVAVA